MKKYTLFVLLTICITIFPNKSFSKQESKIKLSNTTSLAKTFVQLLAKEDFTQATTNFDETMKQAMPENQLQSIWKELITQIGPFKQQVSTRSEKMDKYEIVFVTCEFAKSSIDIKVVFNEAQKIAGLFFVPTKVSIKYTSPDYVDHKLFHEVQVSIGIKDWNLPGTLTLPKTKELVPAIILVHGSGPQDRDETLGPNKPFCDLAQGLASQNIAVLRYEKRSKEYGKKLSEIPNLTVKEEVLDDALAAVSFLRKTKGIDHKRIFILGHSLGGTLAPRIGKLDNKISGLIILAGLAKPLEDAVLEQTKYLCELDGIISEEEKTQIKAIELYANQIKAIKSLPPTNNTMLLGVPTSYWLDLNQYKPTEVAQKLAQPMFIWHC